MIIRTLSYAIELDYIDSTSRNTVPDGNTTAIMMGTPFASFKRVNMIEDEKVDSHVLNQRTINQFQSKRKGGGGGGGVKLMYRFRTELNMYCLRNHDQRTGRVF